MVPISAKIVQDRRNVLYVFGVVHKYGGKMVPNLANINSHCNHASGRNTYGWGGVMIKNLLVWEVG